MRRGVLLAGLSVLGALGLVGAAYGAYVIGTDGDDDITIERSSSVVYLKGGNDTFTGARAKRGGSDHVYGGQGNDRILSYSHSDTLRGQTGNDRLDARSGPDGLYGGPGEDRLLGGHGDDFLSGGSDDDTLIGGPGRDVFRPGKGRDTCIGTLRDHGFPGRCEVVRIVR